MSLVSSRVSSKPAEGGLVQSLCRALLLLEKLSEADNGCRLRDLCRSTGLSPSTAHRLLTTLEQRRFVAFDKDNSIWQVGSKCLTVGAVFMRKRTFLSDAARHMEILSQSLGEIVNLGVLDDDANVLVLKQTRARQLSSGLTAVGSRVSRHASAMGKVLLASKSSTERERALRLPNFTRFTPKTIVEPSNLLAELEIVSARGYAIDDEENAAVGIEVEGILVVAADAAGVGAGGGFECGQEHARLKEGRLGPGFSSGFSGDGHFSIIGFSLGVRVVEWRDS